MPKATVAQPCKLAMSISEDAAPQLGAFNIAMLLQILQGLFPLIAGLPNCGCLNPNPSPAPAKLTGADYQNFLTENWQDGAYPAGIINPVTGETLHASRNAGQKMKRWEAHTLAQVSLDHVRTAPTADVQQAIDMANAA